ncbi:MAG TPA: hypothetical protein VHF69_06705, partial [Candidatus Synoicihabitans sp.]|nr:hypothetical protein [Candidatus Synoicihabitans sp.]
DSALLIPKAAVVYEGGERYVFAVVDGRAARRKLALGFEGIDHLEALSGFEAGTPIIVRGQNGLRDGTTVRMVNRAVAPAAEAESAKATAVATPTSPAASASGT